jgi:hypothetical protein
MTRDFLLGFCVGSESGGVQFLVGPPQKII